MEFCSVMSLDWGELLAEDLYKRAVSAGVGAEAVRSPARVVFHREDLPKMIPVITAHIAETLRPLELRRLTGLLPLDQSEREALLTPALKLSSKRDHTRFVQKTLSEHFERSSLLVTEGIVRFGMPELIEEWASCVDRAGEELLLGGSYSEMFRILGLVSQIAGPGAGSADMCLILHEDGSFVLTDENGCRIESSSCEIGGLIALLTGLGPSLLSVYDLTRGGSDDVVRAIKRLLGDRARFFRINN